MSNAPSRYGIWVGVTAAAAALGAAAMVSATSARADLYDDTVNTIDYNLTSGQTAFGVADTDFGSNNFAGGLTALFDGIDDDSLLAPQSGDVGLVDALTNEPFSGDKSYFALMQPTDFAQAESVAQASYTYGASLFPDAASAFSSGDYGEAAYFDLAGADSAFIVPLEYLLLGAVASF